MAEEMDPIEGTDPKPEPALPPGIQKGEDGAYSAEIVVDGVTQRVPLDQVINDATKVGGADARFREAADLRQQASVAIDGMAIHEKIREGTATDDEKNRYCDIYEADDDYRQRLIAGPERQKEPKEQETTVMADPVVSKPIGEQDLSPELRAQLNQLGKANQETAREKILADISSDIDSAELYGKLVGEIKADSVPAFKERVEKMVKTELLAGLEQNQTYSDQLRKEAVNIVLTDLQKLAGYRSEAEQPPGPAGFGDHSASFGTSVPGGEAPERVAASDQNWVSNSKARILHILRGK